MRELLFRARLVFGVMVIALMIGAVIMIGLGGWYTWEAIASLMGAGHAPAHVSPELGAKLALLEAVDNFLFALVMMYFAYGAYFLVIRKDPPSEDHPLPDWLQVKNVGQMKKTLLEVIILVLAVMFLQVGLAQETEMRWVILVFPISIVALAIAVKIIPFDH